MNKSHGFSRNFIGILVKEVQAFEVLFFEEASVRLRNSWGVFWVSQERSIELSIGRLLLLGNGFGDLLNDLVDVLGSGGELLQVTRALPSLWLLVVFSLPSGGGDVVLRIGNVTSGLVRVGVDI